MREQKSGGGWKRIVLWTSVALVVLVLAGVGGFYLWFREQVSEANERVPEEVKVALTAHPSSTITSVPVEYSPGSPSAMNILVLGSDRRAEEEGDQGRSDTIILLHVDPDVDYLSVLSLPRDLRVEVPGYGLEKINAAYAYGGPALTITTVEQVTGIDIDHYVEVDFQAFRDVTDSLGGVYLEVDRRYYNDDDSWELIDLEPGYQLLNGDDALDYCRYRHDHNMDFGRMERQQRFLSAVRQQAMGWDLPLELPGIITALFSNIATDLGANDIIKLAWWVIGLDGDRIRQLTVRGDLATIAGASYVLFDEEVMAESVGQFFTPPSAGASATTTPTTTAGAGAGGPETTSTTEQSVLDMSGLELDVFSATGRAGEAAAAGEWLTGLGASVVTAGEQSERANATTVEYPSGLREEAERVGSLVDATSVTRDRSLERITVVLGDDFTLPPAYALALTPENVPDAGPWRIIAAAVPFPVRAPAYLPRGYWFVDKRPAQPGTYDIVVGRGSEPALTMLYRLIQDGEGTDQYMGITQTNWLDAPAASEGRKVTYESTVYTVVGSRGKVERIWWKADDVLYWVSNTLSYLLSEEDLMAVAQSMVRIPAE